MKKLKTQKGITLIALIITIVVLLILAVVAIGAVKDSNIIGHAQNAAGGYDKAKGDENNAISDMESILNKYSTGGNSVGNNGGTNNNPGGENNGENQEGGTEQPEITPPEVEEPDVTPPAPVYYSKTLNTNMNDYADALALTGSDVWNGAKITYVSGSNKLEVTLKNGTTFDNFSVIYVIYTDAQGSVSRYAICNPENPWTLEQQKNTATPYDYVPVGSWTQPSGETYTGNYGGTADIYEPITQIPVFEGEWQIDEANTTEAGKTYLSKVLSDVIN